MKASDALKKIKKAAKVPLPRKDYLLSKTMFHRMINDENLAVYKSELPTGTKLGDCMAIGDATREIMLLYIDQSADSDRYPQPYGTELLDMAAFQLKLLAEMMRLVAEQDQSLSAEERTVPERLKWKEMMRKGLATMLQGYIKICTEVGPYREKDLEHFAEQLPKLMPPLYRELPATVQRELLIEIKDQSKNHPIPAVKKSLDELSRKVK